MWGRVLYVIASIAVIKIDFNSIFQIIRLALLIWKILIFDNENEMTWFSMFSKRLIPKLVFHWTNERTNERRGCLFCMKCKWGEESHSTDRQTEERKMHHHLDRRVRLPSSKLFVFEAKQNMEMTKREREREQERYKRMFLGF